MFSSLISLTTATCSRLFTSEESHGKHLDLTRHYQKYRTLALPYEPQEAKGAAAISDYLTYLDRLASLP